MILRVAATNLHQLWPEIEPLAFSALRGCPTHNVEDVRSALLAGTATPFVQWEQRVEVVAITTFATYPRGIWLSIWLIGARPDAVMDSDGFVEVLDHFRRLNKCRGFQASGARDGWLRRFGASMGLVSEGASMRSTVED